MAFRRGPTLADLLTPGFHSSYPETWQSTKLAAKLNMEKMMASKESPALEMTTSMDALVAQMNAILLANQKTFMLGEPLSLTVKRSNGGYSKRPHTGGEDFQALRCYAGKRDKLIYVFRPVDAADYVEMEMDEAQAKKSLNRFADFLKTYAGSDFDRTRKEIAKKNAEEAELEKLATRKEYADLGFGSW